MHRRYKLIQELIALAARFEEENSTEQIDILSFSSWLNDAVKNVDTYQEEVTQYGATHNIQLSAMVAYLFRYAKHYSKKALKDSDLATLDDFVFLATLMFRPGMTKSELIQEHLLEITSGTEILKRLLKQAFIEESENPDDKRSKKLNITPKGRKAWETAQKQMSLAAQIVGGNLEEHEKVRLLQISSKLKKFHDQIHDQDKKSELTEIIGKYF